jgi:hypothetical protein
VTEGKKAWLKTNSESEQTAKHRAEVAALPVLCFEESVTDQVGCPTPIPNKYGNHVNILVLPKTGSQWYCNITLYKTLTFMGLSWIQRQAFMKNTEFQDYHLRKMVHKF